MVQTRQRRPVAGAGAGGAEHTGQEAPRQCSAEPPATRLLSRLEAVRERGPGRWSARCPAHADRHPSLTLRECGDGVLLLRCWAGCNAAEVVGAVGLELSDLFPPRRPGDQGSPPLRRGERWIPRDVLQALRYEATVVALAANDIAAGRPLSDTDMARVREAAARIGRAVDEVTA